MDSYTCITCRVRFNAVEEADLKAAELQKHHFKSDWHRYNLKRKIAELTPVSAETFAEKVLAQRAQQAEVDKSTSCYCTACSKRFTSDKSFQNHLNSKKHREAEMKEENKTEVEKMNEKNRKNTALAEKAGNKNKQEGTAGGSAMEDDGDVSASSGINSMGKTNLQEVECNMEDLEEEEVSDEDWEGEPLRIEECLFCRCTSLTMEKNLNHMTVQHSFFIPDLEYVIDLEGLIAYLGQKVGQFHMCLWCNEKGRVFTETKAVQQHMTDKGHCKLLHEGDSILEYSDFYDYRSSYPDFKERDGKDAEEGDDDEEEVVQGTDLNQSGYQLVLPSGSTVGHRSLLIYFRQKLKPDRRIVLHKNSSTLSKVISHYKSLGWTGTTGVAAQQKARDIAFVERIKSRQFMNLGIKANKLQRHFRDQVFGF